MLTDLSKVTEMPLDLNPVVMTTGNNYTSLKSVPYAKLRVLDICVSFILTATLLLPYFADRGTKHREGR